MRLGGCDVTVRVPKFSQILSSHLTSRLQNSDGITQTEIIHSGEAVCRASSPAPIASLETLDCSLTLRGNERWYLVHTLPRRELQARMRLQAQGFRTYLPQYLRTTRHARQLRTQRAPLFPRYLFIILDLGRDRWLSVRSTIGVAALVSNGDWPSTVPHGITEALIRQADNSNLFLFGGTFETGQKVRIASGPFVDFIGTLDRFDDSDRVRILLEMMGSEIAITVPRTGILPAA
jgi:transcription elongation factor/antiterminator RfaH